jgi:hypothetical protein
MAERGGALADAERTGAVGKLTDPGRYERFIRDRRKETRGSAHLPHRRLEAERPIRTIRSALVAPSALPR